MALVDTYVGQGLIPYINAEEAYASMVHVAFAPNLDLAEGTVLGKLSATGKHAAYDDSLATGVEVALPLITQYPITTDGDGNVTNLGALKQPTGPCFTQGYFRSEDVTGMDAAGLADINGTIVTGNLTTGTFKF
jgi:hypothetical protein